MKTKIGIALTVALAILLGQSVGQAKSTTQQAEGGIHQLSTQFDQLLAQDSTSPEDSDREATTATLTLEDLPDGFQELPPMLETQVKEQFAAISSQFRHGGLEPEELFIFYNPRSLQIVGGFTGEILDTAQFDGSIETLSQPAVQEILFAQIQEQLKDVDMVEVTGYRSLPEMEDFADQSFGIQLDAKFDTGFFTLPLKTDVASFRRQDTGAFTMVMYRESSNPELSLRSLSDRLNGKIVQ
ncbi:hypothetical protein PN462_18525 [Spirulina sp. CS-785/01]|uniref:hypothetical protein n=1 Tax=Spirulina sp. CS-785/01 TaxID=3021716 RepID=UPI00232BA89E|nr:hypothetical protein [Spirulina sp. CS-785/01]MDB9315117.1 hypothetical protein [Spirulina sp. CS-785/01]